MTSRLNRCVLTHLLLFCVLGVPIPSAGQVLAAKKPRISASETQSTEVSEAASEEIQRRAFATSLVNSLAEEARSYGDLALRSRVLARAADTLWEAENETARNLFRRAWASAEIGDAEEITLKTNDNPPPMVIALRRISGRDLRADVLSIVARRDRALGEEFLKTLSDDKNREAKDTIGDAKNAGNNWAGPELAAKRLEVARRLLDDDQVDRALEFAAPVLNQVNANSIGFLSALRRKRPESADQRYSLLLAQAELDPTADANTVSGLSSYAFTPALYITFNALGGATWSQEQMEGNTPPNLPNSIRMRFFQTGASILLRPLPAPDRDSSSAGWSGKYMVIKRLLPLFTQYAADVVPALRAQLADLTSGKLLQEGDQHSALTRGIAPEEASEQTFHNMQERLDHAKNSHERDSIYADAAVALANQGDSRAPDLAAKIDAPNRRTEVVRYVDLKSVLLAIQQKKPFEVSRRSKIGDLTHAQRAWAYTQAARMLMNSEGQRSLEFLVDAADEARRIGANDPDRVHSLINVAKVYVTADQVRAWELMSEASKAANSADSFTGENLQLSLAMATRNGINIVSIGGDDFGLAGVLQSLTKDDLFRSIELARSFKNPSPRAIACLAVAKAVLQEQQHHSK